MRRIGWGVIYIVLFSLIAVVVLLILCLLILAVPVVVPVILVRRMWSGRRHLSPQPSLPASPKSSSTTENRPAPIAAYRPPPEPVVPDSLRNVFPGSMPCSIRVRGEAYRYQSKGHIHRGQDFWKIFEDGPWKWDAQQRYAGAGLNPGHYFAFSPESAGLELAHYVSEGKVEEYEVMSIEGELDNILELTTLDSMQHTAKAVKFGGFDAELIQRMIIEQSGGEELTNVLGFHACRKGYNGIVFFSARAVAPEDRSGTHLMNDMFGDDPFYWALERMKFRISGMVLVVFSGSRLIRSIRKYRFGNGEWEENPFYNWSEAELDLKFQYNAAYQATRGRFSYLPHGVESA
jgi:hypothetical protein